MKPTVQIFGLHLPGKKIVLTSGPADALDKVDVPSPLERYLGRPTDNSFNQVTYLEYHSRYDLDSHPRSSDVHTGVCQAVYFANSRKEKNRFCVSSIQYIPRITNCSHCDYFCGGFALEAGTNCELTMERHVKASMRLLGNLG
jgi:hypothetical protein